MFILCKVVSYEKACTRVFDAVRSIFAFLYLSVILYFTSAIPKSSFNKHHLCNHNLPRNCK